MAPVRSGSNSRDMRLLYVTFWISEGIADRREVSYDTWDQWVAEDYVYGPYDSIVCVYNTIKGLYEGSGERETIALFEEDPNEPYCGYWRVVRREVHERFSATDFHPGRARLAGQPRRYATRPDERLPPFSDWSIDIGTTKSPRSIREVDVEAPTPDEPDGDLWIYF